MEPQKDNNSNRAINKQIKNIQELPSDWELLSNGEEKNELYKIEDSQKKSLAIVKTSYIEDEKNISCILFYR